MVCVPYTQSLFYSVANSLFTLCKLMSMWLVRAAPSSHIRSTMILCRVAGSSITHFPLVLCLFWISGTHLDAQFCGNNISLVSSILLSILFGREFRVLDSSVLQLPMKSGTRALVAGASVIKSKLHDSSKMFFHRLKPVFVM